MPPRVARIVELMSRAHALVVSFSDIAFRDIRIASLRLIGGLLRLLLRLAR